MSGSHLCIPRNETVQPPYFQNRITMFCLPSPTLIYIWEIKEYSNGIFVAVWRSISCKDKFLASAGIYLFRNTYIGQTILEKYKMFCKDKGFVIITTTMWVSRNNQKTNELILNYNKFAVDMKALFSYKFAYFLYIVLERGTHGLINYIDTREKCRNLK